MFTAELFHYIIVCCAECVLMCACVHVHLCVCLCVSVGICAFSSGAPVWPYPASLPHLATASSLTVNLLITSSGNFNISSRTSSSAHQAAGFWFRRSFFFLGRSQAQPVIVGDLKPATKYDIILQRATSRGHSPSSIPLVLSTAPLGKGFHQAFPSLLRLSCTVQSWALHVKTSCMQYQLACSRAVNARLVLGKIHACLHHYQPQGPFTYC